VPVVIALQRVANNNLAIDQDTLKIEQVLKDALLFAKTNDKPCIFVGIA